MLLLIAFGLIFILGLCVYSYSPRWLHLGKLRRHSFKSSAALPIAWRPHATATSGASNLLARYLRRLLATAQGLPRVHYRATSSNAAATSNSSTGVSSSWLPGLGARTGSSGGPVAVVISPRLNGTGMITTGRSQLAGGRAFGHTIIAMAVPGTSEQLKRQDELMARLRKRSSPRESQTSAGGAAGAAPSLGNSANATVQQPTSGSSGASTLVAHIAAPVPSFEPSSQTQQDGQKTKNTVPHAASQEHKLPPLPTPRDLPPQGHPATVAIAGSAVAQEITHAEDGNSRGSASASATSPSKAPADGHTGQGMTMMTAARARSAGGSRQLSGVLPMQDSPFAAPDIQSQWLQQHEDAHSSQPEATHNNGSTTASAVAVPSLTVASSAAGARQQQEDTSLCDWLALPAPPTAHVVTQGIQATQHLQDQNLGDQDQDWLELPAPPAAAMGAKMATPRAAGCVGVAVAKPAVVAGNAPVVSMLHATPKYGLLNKKPAATLLSSSPTPGEVAAAGGDCVASIHILPSAVASAKNQTGLAQQGPLVGPPLKGPLLPRQCQPLLQ